VGLVNDLLGFPTLNQRVLISVIAVGKGNEECIDLDWLEWATYTQLLIK
jgi:hypothetical protein